MLSILYADIGLRQLIALLRKWEEDVLPLICLLIKILFCSYYLGHKFSRNLFSRLTAPKIANFAELVFANPPCSEIRGISRPAGPSMFLPQELVALHSTTPWQQYVYFEVLF